MASTPTPATIGAHVDTRVQECSALISPHVISENPAAEVTTCAHGRPRPSRCEREPAGTSVRQHASTTHAATASRVNIDRQPCASIIIPPTSGPNGAPSAPAAVHTPVARPRCSAGNIRGISASDIGVNTLAPTPMRTRAIINQPADPDVAPTRAPAPNTTAPATSVLRCPRRSPTAPPGSSTARNARL